MNDQPAFPAMFTTFKHMKGSGNYKLEFEIPPQEFDKMRSVLGSPPGPGETKWVGIARLAISEGGAG